MKLIYKYIVFVLVLFYSANTFAQTCESDCGGGTLQEVPIVYYPPPPPPTPPPLFTPLNEIPNDTPPPPPVNPCNNGGCGNSSGSGSGSSGGGSDSSGDSDKEKKEKEAKEKLKRERVRSKRCLSGDNDCKETFVKNGKYPSPGDDWEIEKGIYDGNELIGFKWRRKPHRSSGSNNNQDSNNNQTPNNNSSNNGNNPTNNSANDALNDFIREAQKNNPNLKIPSCFPNCIVTSNPSTGGSGGGSGNDSSNPPRNEDEKIWYLDQDGDGFHSSTTSAKESPGSKWKLNTKGSDCDGDTKKDEKNECEKKVTWYLDYDKDGYYGDIRFESVEDFNGGGFWVKESKGPDCNDYNKNDTTNCCEKEVTCQSFFNETFDEETCRCTTEGGHNWYLDNDGDDYHSQTKRAKNKPGANWKEGTSRGLDCNDSLFDEENICIEDEIVALLNPNNVLIKGTQQEQTPKKQIKHQSKETDKYAKRSVKRNINKTFAKQSFNNCTTASLGFIGKWILRNEINESQLLLKLAELNGALKIAKFLRAGLTPEENIQVIKSLYNTQAFTTFKAAIDNGKAVMTDVFIRDVQEPNPENPEQLLTYRITHAVAVVGYTETGDIIFFDPAEGNFQVAPPESLNQSYAIVLKSTK